MPSCTGLTFGLPDGRLLFENLSVHLDPGEPAALTGANGGGKSVLMGLVAVQLRARGLRVWYVPQHAPPPGARLVDAIGLGARYDAVQRVLAGAGAGADFDGFAADWDLPEKVESLFGRDPSGPFAALSGGERAAARLAAADLEPADIWLLDEPTNHLDAAGRRRFADRLAAFSGAAWVATHDRQLLDLLAPVWELRGGRLFRYGGNGAFWLAARLAEQAAAAADLAEQRKQLARAEARMRQVTARQEKSVREGKRMHVAAGVDKMALHILEDSGERTLARLRARHESKVGEMSETVREARANLIIDTAWKPAFNPSQNRKGRTLVDARAVNIRLGGCWIWDKPQDWVVCQGDRIWWQGPNGSGKTTRIRLSFGDLQPDTGEIRRVRDLRVAWLDQELSVLDPDRTVWEHADACRPEGQSPSQIRTLLTGFGLGPERWNQPAGTLSGGERMRLAVALLQTACREVDVLVLDEPTNHLDLHHVDFLERLLHEYRGTVVLVTHDEAFAAAILGNPQSHA